ncbi:MAG: hypothetical protein SO436_06710 [Oscillospiraceae bacterium]|nr:hypothetical protein [Oscillospiraceae bacterium]MDY4624160.1 hypothetical protein [Oscillospiraceae bacterium]
MSQIKRIHIRSKTIWQIFLMFLEISVIVGGLTWVSGLLWDFESGLDVLERVGLFYGFYQILTYIILSNLNDIKADEFLALKNTASIALKACEYNDEIWKGIAKDQIEKQLDSGVFNDMLVRQNYGVLKQCIDENAVKNIEYMIIWAEHCAEESQLLWRFSFLLRLVK